VLEGFFAPEIKRIIAENRKEQAAFLLWGGRSRGKGNVSGGTRRPDIQAVARILGQLTGQATVPL